MLYQITSLFVLQGDDVLRNVYAYCNEYGICPVLDFIKSAGKKFEKKFEFLIKYIKQEKECLCEPYVKHFSVEKYQLLYELRLRNNGTMIRIIFFLTGNSDIILLHAFYKKEKRDTERALESALKILNSMDSDNTDNNERIAEVTV